MKQLDIIIRRLNPYAEAFKMMHEVETQEKACLIKNGVEPAVVKMLIIRNSKDKHRYNQATCNEVAVVCVGEDEPPIERDICIHSKSDGPINIPCISRHVDPMTYSLMYPAGGFGWMPNMKCLNNKSNITTLQFYSYKLSIRDGFNPFLNLGKLTQQYIIDVWIKVESSRLYYLKKQQHILRTEL